MQKPLKGPATYLLFDLLTDFRFLTTGAERKEFNFFLLVSVNSLANDDLPATILACVNPSEIKV